MSIIASVTVHDAIVIGADSQTTLVGSTPDGQSNVMKTFQHAQKLHQIGNVGVGAWGDGNIGTRSVGSVIGEFSHDNKDLSSSPVEEVATELSGHLNRLADSVRESGLPQTQLGAIVGGYSPDHELAETWEIRVPDDDDYPDRICAPSEFGANWHGVPSPFSRLAIGIDPGLEADLRAIAGNPGVEWGQAIDGARFNFIFDGMPVQDAVDLTAFILRTTIGAARFEVGSQSCGGPLWIAVITKRGGFKWIERPEWKVT